MKSNDIFLCDVDLEGSQQQAMPCRIHGIMCDAGGRMRRTLINEALVIKQNSASENEPLALYRDLRLILQTDFELTNSGLRGCE